MGRYRQAGYQEVGEGAEHGGGGCPFFDRVVEGDTGRQREEPAHGEEQDGGDEADVQARDREQVGESGITHGREVAGGDGAAVTGHQRCRDRAGRAWQAGAHASADSLAQLRHSIAYRRLASRLDKLDSADRIPHRAEAVEKGLALEIEGARRT